MTTTRTRTDTRINGEHWTTCRKLIIITLSSVDAFWFRFIFSIFLSWAAFASINIYEFLLLMQCGFYELHGILLKSRQCSVLHVAIFFSLRLWSSLFIGQNVSTSISLKRTRRKWRRTRKKRWMSLKSQINQYVCVLANWMSAVRKKKNTASEKSQQQGTACMFRDCTSYRSCLCTSEHIAHTLQPR